MNGVKKRKKETSVQATEQPRWLLGKLRGIEKAGNFNGPFKETESLVRRLRVRKFAYVCQYLFNFMNKIRQFFHNYYDNCINLLLVMAIYVMGLCSILSAGF